MATPEQRDPTVVELLARIEDLEGRVRGRRGIHAWVQRLVKPVVAVCMVLALTGVVFADIPDSGIINGCVTNSAFSGQHILTLIDTSAGGHGVSGQTAIHWNQTGPQGPQGAKGDIGLMGAIGPPGPKGDTGGARSPGLPGATGAQGLAGTGATVAAEPPGANCAFGGANITDGSGKVAYACTGAPGSQGTTGATGAQGPKGDTGAQGPQGAQATVLCPSCSLSFVSLAQANLSGAALYQASLSGAGQIGAAQEGADLSSATLQNASGGTAAFISGVTWSNTTCPDSSNSATNGTAPQSCVGHGF